MENKAGMRRRGPLDKASRAAATTQTAEAACNREPKP